MGEKRSSRWMMVLVGLLAALLPVLALLQYRWIGTLGEAEAARMQRTLRASVTRFVDDVYRPLDRMRAAFLLGAPSDEGPLAEALARRLRRWQAAEPHARLLDAVYWIEADTALALARLDPDAGALTPQPWPTALAPWRAYAARLAAYPERDAKAPAGPPALLFPFRPFPPAGDGGFLLLTLDANYAARTLFPTLVQTHFIEGTPADFDVLIESRAAPAPALFRSRPGLNAAALGTPDAEADLGLLSRVQMTTRVDDGAGTFVAVLREAAVGGGDLEVFTTETEQMILEPSRKEVEREAAPNDETDLAPDAVITAGPFAPWRLRVQHRAGSIEAAVTGWRWRNLAVSFGILLVLGGAVGLLYAAGRRAQRLAEQQVAFVAGVTHELRTPLAVIRAAAENLADGVVADPERARRYGQLIHTEGRRLSELVEQALALAGAQSNHATLGRRPVAVGPLLEAALDRCRPALDDAGCTVTLTVPDSLPPVSGDARVLEGAVSNLIANAAKYGGADGWVGIDAALVEDGRTTEVAVTVRDRGPGIPAAEQPHLFEPFFRGQQARDAQVRGSGLGLSLVRRTAEAHGGRVTVRSAAGHGTAFTIFLPIDAAP